MDRPIHSSEKFRLVLSIISLIRLTEYGNRLEYRFPQLISVQYSCNFVDKEKTRQYGQMRLRLDMASHHDMASLIRSSSTEQVYSRYSRQPVVFRLGCIRVIIDTGLRIPCVCQLCANQGM